MKTTPVNTPSRSRIWNANNAKTRETRGQLFHQPSMTVPDQSLTPRQLLKRHASGLTLEGGRTPVWEDEEFPTSGINPKTLDLVDFQELREKNELELKELKERASAESAEAKKAKAEAAKAAKENELIEIKKRLKEEGEH